MPTHSTNVREEAWYKRLRRTSVDEREILHRGERVDEAFSQLSKEAISFFSLLSLCSPPYILLPSHELLFEPSKVGYFAVELTEK